MSLETLIDRNPIVQKMGEIEDPFKPPDTTARYLITVQHLVRIHKGQETLDEMIDTIISKHLPSVKDKDGFLNYVNNEHHMVNGYLYILFLEYGKEALQIEDIYRFIGRNSINPIFLQIAAGESLGLNFIYSQVARLTPNFTTARALTYDSAESKKGFTVIKSRTIDDYRRRLLETFGDELLPIVLKNDCLLTQGILEGGPKVVNFDNDFARVVEEPYCESRGDDFCEHHLEWDTKLYLEISRASTKSPTFIPNAIRYLLKGVGKAITTKIINNLPPVRKYIDSILQMEVEIQKNAEELEEANTKLRDQEVTELLGDVMGWVRHSLGQPMMALVGYIKGLQGSETKYAESKQQMYDAAQNLSSRISSLHGEIEKTPGTEESYRNILTAFDKDILEPTVQLMRATKYLGEEYDPAFQKDIGGATQVITQIRGLVSNLEKFVRREDPANMSLIPLKDYVTQYVKVYSQGTFQDGQPYSLQENSIVIEIDIPENLTVYSAKGVLDDIFYNPLQNCIDHAFLDKEKDVEGRIGIKGYSITEDGIDKTIIEISDNGCGMSEDTLKNIFKPQVTAKKIGMGGLGAASLKRWVLWHRYGSVEYESEPGRGTLVRITLPSREY